MTPLALSQIHAGITQKSHTQISRFPDLSGQISRFVVGWLAGLSGILPIPSHPGAAWPTDLAQTFRMAGRPCDNSKILMDSDQNLILPNLQKSIFSGVPQVPISTKVLKQPDSDKTPRWEHPQMSIFDLTRLSQICVILIISWIFDVTESHTQMVN